MFKTQLIFKDVRRNICSMPMQRLNPDKYYLLKLIQTTTKLASSAGNSHLLILRIMKNPNNLAKTSVDHIGEHSFGI